MGLSTEKEKPVILKLKEELTECKVIQLDKAIQEKEEREKLESK